MANRPWVMKQEWHEVVFLHWPIQAEWLRRHVPAELELDLFDGFAWIGVVLFKANGTNLRGISPIPVVPPYLELNVRTYVKYKGRSGVYFFSLDADSALAVKAASTGDFLPYRHARMSMNERQGTCVFESRRTHRHAFPEALSLSYKIASAPIKKNFFDSWLTERYCLWTKPKNRLLRVDIDHPPWELQYIQGEIFKNTMASFLPKNFHLERPIAHYGGTQKVLFFPPAIE